MFALEMKPSPSAIPKWLELEVFSIAARIVPENRMAIGTPTTDHCPNKEILTAKEGKPTLAGAFPRSVTGVLRSICAPLIAR